MSIRTTAEMRELARNRLIESRLTPNAISITGLIGNLIAAFLILDESARQASFHRVHYPVQKAQMRMLEAGLPPLLAQRLQRGV